MLYWYSTDSQLVHVVLQMNDTLKWIQSASMDLFSFSLVVVGALNLNTTDLLTVILYTYC